MSKSRVIEQRAFVNLDRPLGLPREHLGYEACSSEERRSIRQAVASVRKQDAGWVGRKGCIALVAITTAADAPDRIKDRLERLSLDVSEIWFTLAENIIGVARSWVRASRTSFNVNSFAAWLP